MKSIIQFDAYAEIPLLRMYLHGCPHKRMHRAVLQRCREELTHSAERQIGHKRQGGSIVNLPIDFEIDLEITFINPASPDLDHMIEAVFMMLDGKNGSLTGPSVLIDDRLIQGLQKVRKFYPEAKTKRESER